VDGKEAKNLLGAVMAALKDEKDISVTDDEKKSKKSDDAPAKKGKKAAAKDEDDEEEEEADEDESTDEDDDEEEEETEDEDSDEEEEDEKPAKKKGKAVKSAGGDGKPGVIGTIVEALKGASKTKPITKAGILAKLTKAFPDRDAKGMKSTINIQVPARLKAEKKLNIVKVENEDGPVSFYVKG
jgi:hypothetical protein